MAASVEITTTQNVTIEYELARLRERGAAFLLDGIILVFAYLIFFLLILALFGGNFMDQGWALFFTLFFFAFYFCYYIVGEAMLNGQTIGKMATGIKVVRLDGKEPQWSDVVLRAVLQIVDLLSCAGIIGVILVKTTPKCQRLGDMAANTTVIKIQRLVGRYSLRDILNITSLEHYQPRYPQVRQLAETDMILIKNSLARFQKYPNPAHHEALEALSERLRAVLNIQEPMSSITDFLRTLLRDYIVLTR